MKTRSLKVLVAALATVAASIPAMADRQQDLLAVLTSSADIPAKCEACKELRTAGTADCVSVLAGLLGDERLSQAARYALEGMPFPEAVRAMREALPKVNGLNKAGLMDSLGWRRDVESVPLLKAALSESDTAVASAAATALGRIGGQPAIDALLSARAGNSPAVQLGLHNALLRCADALLADGKSTDAAQLYASLRNPDLPQAIRLAAWRGQVLADRSGRAQLVFEALTGGDQALCRTALVVFRELNDPDLVRAGLDRWGELPPGAQIAVLDGAMKQKAQSGKAIQLAGSSPLPLVRTAAWSAMAEANDTAHVPALAKAASQSEGEERDAAREALARLAGPAARRAILAQVSNSEPGPKAELLRALGARNDKGAAPLLLDQAAQAPGPVRTAAIESLRRIAAPETAVPLLSLAANGGPDSEPLLNALYAVCQASPDKAQLSPKVLSAMEGYTDAQRCRVLPVLAELGTPDALSIAVNGTRSNDAELRRAAVRVLSDWPNASAAPELLALARGSSDPGLQTLALRGAVKVSAHETSPPKQLEVLQAALGASTRPDEKVAVLGQMGQVATPEALQGVLPLLSDPELANEAGLAAINIAEKLAATKPEVAREAATEVIVRCKAAPVLQRARNLRGEQVAPSPFIDSWLVCGPYTQPGVSGALGIFPVALGPELSQPVQWRTMPRGKQVNLAAVFPGFENCAAYLKAQLVAPAATEALLLLGSDDGVKAWLNGVVVHSNNVDRGEIPDQDKAPVRLKAGTNELMLKITQGGGGWSASARVVGADGQPVPGLRVVQQNAPLAKAVPPKPAPAPVPAVPSGLPPRDNYRKLRLSDQFYAEGAYFADFNRDGKLDLVAGPFWFEGPAFQQRREYRPVKTFEAAKEYSDNFLTYAGDMNGDGWPDILCVPFPGKEGYWYENPAGKDGHWRQHLAYTNIGNESPIWGDVTGLGRPQQLFCNDGYLGYAAPDFAKPNEPWVFHAVSGADKRYQRFTHGVGFGDINGDRRNDVVEAVGWWEQPAQITEGKPWIFHPFHFSDGAAQMYVYDVDGNGLADVITAWHCHLYGLVWWQQARSAEGSIDWRQHVILPPKPDLKSSEFRVSQLHAMVLQDMDGDGVMDILTGKRFWSHGPTGDVEPDAAAVVFWFEVRRSAGGVTFAPHLIDDDSGVGTQVAAADLNADKRPDVMVANKKGIFIHLSQPPQK